MTAVRVVPYGSWPSPISARMVASGGVGLGSVMLDGDATYWVEQRPAEGGRAVVVRCGADGRVADVTPAPYSARSRVHEYGGGAYAVADGTVYFSNVADGRVYVQRAGAPPEALTPDGRWRYADLAVDRRQARLVCVREDHSDASRESVNTVVTVRTDRSAMPSVLVEGADFYASPRLSPDGTRLAYLAWHHPNMPWDGTELWVAEHGADGTLTAAARVAGGPEESIFQPQWSPDGVLYFVSDRSGWWNLHRWQGGAVEPLCAMAAEFGLPQWNFGMSTYGFADAVRLVCALAQGGTRRLAVLHTRTGEFRPLELPYVDVDSVQAAGGRAVFVAGTPTEVPAVVELDLGTRRCRVRRRATDERLDPGCLSTPQAIDFRTAHGATVHAFFYAPRNVECTAPATERPPLLVMSHGGPTAVASSALRLAVQFWTSRGIAVLDVNYRGSTGYGRAYRQHLDGQWGVVDVDDCVDAARHAVACGLVDGERLAIRGSSAGGFTTLCALSFHDVFKAGASYYGIGDLEALQRDTHKFESHYEARLVGPYPARRDLYRARSPIHFTDRLSCPVIFFQGLDDAVVPPTQAEAMVAALRAKRLPVAYLAFAGEAHGFRRAENIQRALEAELYFYSRVFGFAPADPLEPVAIENLSPLAMAKSFDGGAGE